MLFNPAVVSYKELLMVLFDRMDPTTLNRYYCLEDSAVFFLISVKETIGALSTETEFIIILRIKRFNFHECHMN